ncbi:bifunctional pyr operon transcriptional regulator/uracil phosphoribosyltransferase PyrR [Pseudomethylobacillus aquaticus]|uniref:Bifunctional pyr operon transcriptional regulator/uracil phosphoribosyltransferase PyrR n=1 Tax=Pseudomethylobacillus aquaticus TaxID=2676064 RepID=A0A3N0V394_9PROT|nr:bifunctional pyr operon transcriptional regulator/uracil phosphoribosyltransferase PyrR [Pseudomethylobacillus aquaticus]ROH87276.1 bifunctional pyr operon transcriptional regulator/uracil phosphoribosyltransferase PyrR [Pseudomethylobacillus aquaticus]
MTTPLPEAEQLLTRLAEQLRPVITPATALVGIHSGGVWIMQRLLKLLDVPLAHGTLDVSFYRDDFNQRGLKPTTRPSQIPFEVEARHIILIDDVFYTGRTIRAALNELFDYGRPANISLAVLVNRGGRELPIAPQFSACELPLPADKNLQLLQHEDGRFYLRLDDQA